MRGAVSTTMPDGLVLAYVVVMMSPATPGFGSKIVPSMLTVTVRKYCVVTVGNDLVRRAERALPGTELLLVPQPPAAQTPDAD